MTKKEDLEKVITEKIKPLIDTSMQKFMGVTIKELSTDISDKLKRTPLLDFKIKTSLPFKKAKNLFKKDYIKKLLEISQGSIADVAKISGIDRRSVHRFTKDIKKDINKLRKELKTAYKTGTVISSMIEESLGTLKGIIKPDKLDNVYRNVTTISKDILKELPVMKLTLKQALHKTRTSEASSSIILKFLATVANMVSKLERLEKYTYPPQHVWSSVSTSLIFNFFNIALVDASIPG